MDYRTFLETSKKELTEGKYQTDVDITTQTSIFDIHVDQPFTPEELTLNDTPKRYEFKSNQIKQSLIGACLIFGIATILFFVNTITQTAFICSGCFAALMIISAYTISKRALVIDNTGITYKPPFKSSYTIEWKDIDLLHFETIYAKDVEDVSNIVYYTESEWRARIPYIGDLPLRETGKIISSYLRTSWMVPDV